MGLEPTPLVPEVTQAFTTPQLLIGSYPPPVFVSFALAPRTPVVRASEIGPVHQLANRRFASLGQTKGL